MGDEKLHYKRDEKPGDRKCFCCVGMRIFKIHNIYPWYYMIWAF